MHEAVAVAQAYITESHLFHLARLAGDLDHVALAHLVLDQQEEPGEVVPDQALRAERDGDAGDAGGGEHRRDRDAELVSTSMPATSTTITEAK